MTKRDDIVSQALQAVTAALDRAQHQPDDAQALADVLAAASAALRDAAARSQGVRDLLDLPADDPGGMRPSMAGRQTAREGHGQAHQWQRPSGALRAAGGGER